MIPITTTQSLRRPPPPSPAPSSHEMNFGNVLRTAVDTASLAPVAEACAGRDLELAKSGYNDKIDSRE